MLEAGFCNLRQLIWQCQVIEQGWTLDDNPRAFVVREEKDHEVSYDVIFSGTRALDRVRLAHFWNNVEAIECPVGEHKSALEYEKNLAADYVASLRLNG